MTSFINGDHDRWINGEDLIYEYVHFTKDEIRGFIFIFFECHFYLPKKGNLPKVLIDKPLFRRN